MKKGTKIGLGVGGAILLLLACFAVFAAGIGKEASGMDSTMKDDLSKHMAFDDVKRQLAAQGYAVIGSGALINANGPEHMFVLYTTHLTLKIDFDPDSKMTGYHLDRA